MMAAHFEEKLSKTGKPYYLVTRAELEHLPGFRSSAGGKARAACPFHGGDNPQALEIDFEQGTAHCYTRGCFARIVETADGYGAPLRPHMRPQPENLIKPNNPARAMPAAETIAKLAAAFERARAALPTSPAVAYLARRGIALELAERYGLGWSTAGSLANRLIFPLSVPDGTITSASGRTLSDSITPKYLNLGEKVGYVKGWFHAHAITRSRETGAPVYVCEGVFDVLALLSGGIETATAIVGKKDPRLTPWLAQWVSGAPGVVLCPDEDDDGGGRAAYEKAARELMLFIPAIVAPRGYLDDCKDLGEYWQTHRALPPVLAELIFSPAPAQGSPYAPESDERPLDDSHLSDRPLTPELEALLKPEWFTAPVPVHLLSSDEVRALARCGQPYEVTGAPICETLSEHLPAACIGGQVCAALGPCERAPHCRIDEPKGKTE
jgi:DNA primase catalytic core, N-terminal domain